MKFKLDENLGRSIQTLFRQHDHDCLTVWDEGLSEADDSVILQAAVTEDRVLVTNDFDFSNVLVYPPEKTAGIVVLNPPGRVSRSLLKHLVEVLLRAMSTNTVQGKLWIVEPTRIREHQPGRFSD